MKTEKQLINQLRRNAKKWHIDTTSITVCDVDGVRCVNWKEWQGIEAGWVDCSEPVKCPPPGVLAEEVV